MEDVIIIESTEIVENVTVSISETVENVNILSVEGSTTSEIVFEVQTAINEIGLPEDGAKGDKGDKGDDGYTPVKNVDYFDGAKGDKGDKGDLGSTGAAGTDANVTKQNITIAMDGDYQSFIRTLSTGIKSGGNIHQNIDFANKFDIEAGSGTFVNAYSNIDIPTITHIQWAEIVGVTDEFLATDFTTYVRIDRNGAITQSAIPITEIERRDLIELGWIDHPNNTTLDFFYQEPATNINLQSQFNDFLEAFKQFNVLGNEYSALSGLTMIRSAGRTFDNNANYANDIRSPHIIDTEIESPCLIYYYYLNGAGGWVNDTEATINIDPNNYDDGSGILQSVPTGKWTIQIITFYAVYESNDVQYGQNVYDTFEEALSAIKNPIEINPYNEADTFRAWLIVKQGATDLTDISQAVFRSGGKFGINDAGSGSIGGSGGEVNTSSNIGMDGVGVYSSKSGVTLQFKNIKGSDRIGVADNALNKTVDLTFIEDATHRLVTDTEKGTWNGKPDLGETSTTAYVGDKGKIAYDHSQTSHAPANAQKNSDITKGEIESKLTGEISSHSHAVIPSVSISQVISLSLKL